jgi:hypothetical protein
MHNLKFIQRRFPEHAQSIATAILLLSSSALVLGLGLLLSR